MDRTLRRAWVAWNPVDSNYAGYVACLDEDGGEVAHTAHPILDRSRAGEAADRVGEGETVIAGVVANCAHCAWKGTFANQAELIGAYAAHAHEAHGAARPEV